MTNLQLILKIANGSRYNLAKKVLDYATFWAADEDFIEKVSYLLNNVNEEVAFYFGYDKDGNEYNEKEEPEIVQFPENNECDFRGSDLPF